MPGPLFKRFAPPTPATAKEPSPPAVTPKKEKKSKKTAEVVAAPVKDAQKDVVMGDAPAPKPLKKSKKRKSEVVQEEDEQNEGVSKKHKAVFSKYEKASKLAEARKDEASETIEEPEEDLHGMQAVYVHMCTANSLLKILSLCHSQRPYPNLNLRLPSRPYPRGLHGQSPSRHRRPHLLRSLVRSHNSSRGFISWVSIMRSPCRPRCCQCCTTVSSNIWETYVSLRRLAQERQWHTFCPSSRP